VSLDVYLYGVRIGKLDRAGGGYQLIYEPEVTDGFGSGKPVLSNLLPARPESFSPETTQAFVEGMLPTGVRRRAIAAELGIDPGDGYALIAALGRDCPGAVSFAPEGEPLWGADSSPAPQLSAEELEELVAAPPKRLFDPDRAQRMRFLLPGRRHKLALRRDGRDDPWAWPEEGSPSTHVVKPETGKHPDFAVNEKFCTTVLHEVGMWVVPTEVETIAGRPCLVSKRFDRGTENGQTNPFHQESFCQALGITPGFAESCGLLRAIGEEDSVTVLFALQVCNYLLGNGDCHPENLALLFTAEGPLQAPFYDIASTAVYGDPLHVGLTITKEHFETPRLADLARIAEECDFEFEVCRNVVGNMAMRLSEALPVVVEQARQEDWHAPVVDEITELTTERALDLIDVVDG